MDLVKVVFGHSSIMLLKMEKQLNLKYLACSDIYYTPGIYADGYIVFAFPFVRSSVRMFVSSFVRSFVRSFVSSLVQ